MNNKYLASKFWVWGYLMDETPDMVSFVPNPTYCSLETAAQYLDLKNIVYMNPMHDLNLKSYDSGKLERFNSDGNIICAITNDSQLCSDAALRISRQSLRHPNIKGALIDDFLDHGGATDNLSVETMKQTYYNLKSVNPELKLYVVRYMHQDPHELDPYLDYFDVINLWNWVSTEYGWRAVYDRFLHQLRRDTGKPVIQGIFLHNYAETYKNTEEPVPLDLLELQCEKIFPKVRDGSLDGCIFLQSGWFSAKSHRKQVEFLREYLNWFINTTSVAK